MSKSKNEQVARRVGRAAKFSVAAELSTKLIVPVVNMILARLLTPEAFGVVATISIITSFTDIFTDAGFHKYLVQHPFKNNEEYKKSTNVAFIANFAISVFFWIVISVFNKPIATALGDSSIGFAIIVALMQLPITAFTSIQTAVFRRELDFKILLISRLAIAIAPLVVTVPLAALGFNYWSLIAGNIAGRLISAVILTVKSPWKPKLYFNFAIFRKMFKKSMYLMAETISQWLCNYFDFIIIGVFVSTYFLGLYRNSYQMVSSIMTLFTVSLLPVLLSSLSKLFRMGDDKKFSEIFLTFQAILAYILFPIGTGILLFRDLAVSILFGSNWAEADNIVGVVAVSLALKAVFVDILSTAFVAKGRPRLSVAMNLTYLLITTPIALVAVQKGFWEYLYVKCALVLAYILIGVVLAHWKKIVRVRDMIVNVLRSVLATAVMAIFVITMQSLLPDNIVLDIIIILMAVCIYGGVVWIVDKGAYSKAKEFLRLK